MEIGEQLVRNALETKYIDLPQDDIDITKLAILDTIGCMMAGATYVKG